jgi:hypothetical protein
VKTSSVGVIRAFLAFEAVTFITAALIHAGVIGQGYQHPGAMTGESVIATALVIGLAFTWTTVASTRTVGLVAQGFALLGTLVGISTIVVGVGPQTLPDITYHLAITAVLIVGLVVAARGQAR